MSSSNAMKVKVKKLLSPAMGVGEAVKKQYDSSVENFPQEWTYEYRNVKVWGKDAEKVIDEYPLNNGKYIHAFI